MNAKFISKIEIGIKLNVGSLAHYLKWNEMLNVEPNEFRVVQSIQTQYFLLIMCPENSLKLN